MKTIFIKIFILVILVQKVSAGIEAESISFNTVRSPASSQESTHILKAVYRNIKPAINLITDRVRRVCSMTFTQVVKPEMLGDPLNYPNPFKLTEGTCIGYELSTNMKIELQIYDMKGHCIYKKEIAAGLIGGSEGYNKVPINKESFNKYDLSSGIYFYVIVYNGKVIGKGKMSIVP